MRRQKNRGYIFTTDAAFGIFLMLAMTAFLYYGHPGFEDSSIGIINTQLMMDDVFDILDEKKTLDTFDANQILADINSVMPEHLDYRIRIERFEYGPGGFDLETTLQIGNWTEDLAEIENVHGRRLFLQFDDEEVTQSEEEEGGEGEEEDPEDPPGGSSKVKTAKIEYFHNLEYWVWLK